MVPAPFFGRVPFFGRISGISPSDIATLLVQLKRRQPRPAS
jgi:hypothetical protein